MAMSRRERYILLVLGLVIGIVAADRLALSPYLAWRAERIARRDAGNRGLIEARQVLDREKRLRELLTKMGAAAASDSSTVEGRLLNLLHEWEQQAGVGGASFHRVRLLDRHDYTTMSFQISAGGSMSAVAKLLYAVETASIPLRVDDVQLNPRGDGGDELTIQLMVSTLYRQGGRPAPQPSSPPSLAVPPKPQDMAALEPAKELQ